MCFKLLLLASVHMLAYLWTRTLCAKVPPGFYVNSCMDMLQLYAVPQFEHLQPHIILQQDDTPPIGIYQYRHTSMRHFWKAESAEKASWHNTTGFLHVEFC
jgi:hypothetical protein